MPWIWPKIGKHDLCAKTKITEDAPGTDEVQKLWIEASADTGGKIGTFLRIGQPDGRGCDYFNSCYKFF